LLGFLEHRGLAYVVVARLTLWLKREAARGTQWRALDEHYAVGEFSLQLSGWDRPRRFVVIREQLHTERAAWSCICPRLGAACNQASRLETGNPGAVLSALTRLVVGLPLPQRGATPREPPGSPLTGIGS
jgi:hypothetical protein